MTRALFLSASIPDPERNPVYFTTMDPIAIRDSIRALATVALPHATLVWGGHPSITPLIRVVAQSMGLTGNGRVRLFQSEWFSESMPEDNATFESVELTPAMPTREQSIAAMRRQMLDFAQFDAAIFIGGMEGVEEEFDLFRALHRGAKVYPIASTGGAALRLYERERDRLNLRDDLLKFYSYATLFRQLLELPLT